MIRTKRNYFGLSALLLMLGCLPQVSWASAPSCTVNSPALNFGTYDPVTGAVVTSSATITVTCDHKNVGPFPIELSAGLYSGGAFNPRVMQNTAGTDTLNYNLYINTTYIAANIWGTTASGLQTVSYTTGNVGPPSTASVTVNGQIPANQDPTGVCPSTPCTYNDTVTITITF